MSGKPYVVMLGPMYGANGEALVREHANATLLDPGDRAAVMSAMGGVNAITPRYPNKVDAEMIAAAPDLVVIATSGRGTDAVDVAAASRHGVAVVNNPGFGKLPVSEHAVGLLLGLARHIAEHDRITRAGDAWDKRLKPSNTIRDLNGSTLGIVGLGEIGREMARKCSLAFGMTVIAYDPYVTGEVMAASGAEKAATLEEVLKRADFVSIHAELNDETRFMFNETTLRLMQPHAMLVNTARGKIVEEAALVKALKEGWIRAAALDVYQEEPVGPASALAELDNVLLTPHVAGLTEAVLRQNALTAATQLLQALRGERPENLVNPEAWEQAKQRAARITAG